MRILLLHRLCGWCWQARFFDCVLRSVEEYSEMADYDHLNSVTAGLAKRAEDPEWPGARDYTGRLGREVSENLILVVNRVGLLVNEGARI
jgi:hypothetical protein